MHVDEMCWTRPLSPSRACALRAPHRSRSTSSLVSRTPRARVPPRHERTDPHSRRRSPQALAPDASLPPRPPHRLARRSQLARRVKARDCLGAVGLSAGSSAHPLTRQSPPGMFGPMTSLEGLDTLYTSQSHAAAGDDTPSPAPAPALPAVATQPFGLVTDTEHANDATMVTPSRPALRRRSATRQTAPAVSD